MKTPSRLIFNCGASHLAAGRFSVDAAGHLLLERWSRRDLDCDPSVDDQWLPALTRAMRDLVQEMGGVGDAVIIAPGFQLLNKVIRVPAVEPSRQAQTVAYEVQQNMPYPLSEVVWDWHPLRDDGVEIEAVVVAVKADLAERFCERISGLGVRPVGLAASPVLDYNAYLNRSSGEEEDTLLLNLGARSSNLLCISRDGFFIRSIALGGNALTQMLGDALGKPFKVAEEFKIRVFEGEVHLAQNDPSKAMIEDTCQRFMRRLGAEITRSVASFRRQSADFAPVRMLLTGRGSRLPRLGDFLHQRLNIPVAPLEAARDVVFAAGVDTGNSASFADGLSEVIGEAAMMRPMPAGGVRIDLLPHAIRRRLDFARRRPFLLGAACLLVAAAAIPAVYFRNARVSLDRELAPIRQRLAPLQERQREMWEMTDRIAHLSRRAASWQSMVTGRANWVNFLADLQERLNAVEDVWLEDLRVLRTTPVRESRGEDEGNASAGGLGPNGVNENETELWDGQHPSAPVLTLQLSGRMLDRENPLAKVSANVQHRVARLLDSFSDSAFIMSVENQRFDASQHGLLKFEFSLLVNPEKAL